MGHKVLYLKTDEDIKMMMDPYRQKILKAYDKSDVSMTAKQVADHIGEPPAKVNYHIKKLVDYGALKLEKTENINGILAKFYHPTFHYMKFMGETLSKQVYVSQIPMIEEIFNKTAEKFSNDLHKHVELVTNSEGNIQRKIMARLMHLSMTKDEQLDLIEKIEKLIEPYHDIKKDNDSKEVFSMMMAMARIK